MFISTNFLKNSIEKYNIAKKENFEISKKSINKGVSESFNTFIVIIAMIFFILELCMLYFGIYIALNCTKSVQERIVHLVLVTFFTMPYMLLNVLFNPCAKEYLRNGMKGNVSQV
jgi:ABC-type arginine transport system permease subunit